MSETEDHYTRLAGAYDQNWAYSPDFVERMGGAMASTVQLSPNDTLVDVGGGTGLYTRELARIAHLEKPSYCVDPSQAMLDQIPAGNNIIPIHASAEQLASGEINGVPEQIDTIVIKEAVHHFENPAETIKKLAQRLQKNGRMLIAMLPVEISYPLFDAALSRFTELQPDPRDMGRAMGNAGLLTSYSTFEYPLTFERTRYLGMVRDRYMSLLSTFSDEELQRGIEEIENKYTEPELSFVDRFSFVLGVRAH